jgi:hypothetical protein
MKIENNIGLTEIIIRHFAGLLVTILGGFLGYYVQPIFFILVPFGPMLIVTALLGFCPYYSLMGINHAKS